MNTYLYILVAASWLIVSRIPFLSQMLLILNFTSIHLQYLRWHWNQLYFSRICKPLAPETHNMLCKLSMSIVDIRLIMLAIRSMEKKRSKSKISARQLRCNNHSNNRRYPVLKSLRKGDSAGKKSPVYFSGGSPQWL